MERLDKKQKLKVTSEKGTTGSLDLKTFSKWENKHKPEHTKLRSLGNLGATSSIPDTLRRTPLSHPSTKDAMFAAQQKKPTKLLSLPCNEVEPAKLSPRFPPPIKMQSTSNAVSLTESKVSVTSLPRSTKPLHHVHKVQSVLPSNKETSLTSTSVGKVNHVSASLKTHPLGSPCAHPILVHMHKGRSEVTACTKGAYDGFVKVGNSSFRRKSKHTIPTSSGRSQPTLGSTHSTSSPTHTTSSHTHFIMKAELSLAHMIATSKDAHRDTTNGSTVRFQVSKPVTTPTMLKYDQPGCELRFSHVGLLNLHKHNEALTFTQSETVAAECTLDRKKQMGIHNVGNVKAHNQSSSVEGASCKLVKLENDKTSVKATMSVHNTCTLPRRNVARKSTGSSLKRRTPMKRMQLSLRKVSTNGLNLRLLGRMTDLARVHPRHPLANQNSSNGYRSSKFRHNLIRTHRLPTSNQKATFTSDYISLQTDAEATSLEQASTNSLSSSLIKKEDDSVCARSLPFIGNCARTRKFNPEIFGKQKKPSEQKHSLFPSTSTLSPSEEEVQICKPKDRKSPVVPLAPAMSEKALKVNSIQKPTSHHAASTEPLPVSSSVNAVHEGKPGRTVQSNLEQQIVPNSVVSLDHMVSPQLSSVDDSTWIIHDEDRDTEREKQTHTSVEPLASTCSMRPKSPDIETITMKSPGAENNEYTQRLLQTIAKLSGGTSLKVVKSRR